ncbi:hypothetical protein SVAN01_00324 [Stagonosporopsis vannaccii]|nr:hypothetical protein SVAN01_00324 [Stagonosporopsis vannaccii]
MVDISHINMAEASSRFVNGEGLPAQRSTHPQEHVPVTEGVHVGGGACSSGTDAARAVRRSGAAPEPLETREKPRRWAEGHATTAGIWQAVYIVWHRAARTPPSGGASWRSTVRGHHDGATGRLSRGLSEAGRCKGEREQIDDTPARATLYRQAARGSQDAGGGRHSCCALAAPSAAPHVIGPAAAIASSVQTAEACPPPAKPAAAAAGRDCSSAGRDSSLCWP